MYMYICIIYISYMIQLVDMCGNSTCTTIYARALAKTGMQC
jgi:hypothetical protein